MTCEACGCALEVGDWPYCPHGKGMSAAHGDDIPGGMVVENGFSSPRKFYSHSEHRAALAAEGCEMRPRWVPGDKILTNWAAGIDAYTLSAAAALVSRGTRAPVPEQDSEPVAVVKRDTGESFRFRRT